MIAYLTGIFSYKSPALVFVEVNGIGYEVNISLNTYSQIQNLKEGKLFTYLHIKEDAHTLYGFFEQSEKEMFLLLTSVSGVGAATARMMLSGLQSSEIAAAILANDTAALERVKGIGKKTAQRLVLELKDKVGKLQTGSEGFVTQNNSLQQDALNALVALGIAKPLAEKAIAKILKEEAGIDQIEVLIKKALKAI